MRGWRGFRKPTQFLSPTSGDPLCPTSDNSLSSPAPPPASAWNSRNAAPAGFDLLIAADEPEIETAAAEIRALGKAVDTVQADLSSREGVDRLYQASQRIGRPVDALLANAGRGLGHAFLDQDFIAAGLSNAAAHGRPHPDHRIDCRIRPGKFSGGLQRHQGLQFVFLCPARRAAR